LNKIKVLFLCTHNSARSQIAEGLLSHFYGGKYKVFSAGSSPTDVHPLTIEVMDEMGIDISRQTSKSIEEFRNKDIDVVASVCKSSAKVVCPFCSSPLISGRPEIIDATLPRAKHYINHGFDDPSEMDGSDEEKLVAFRRTRDAIKEWILDYFADLKTEGSGSSA
jgi:arsenate reductase